MNEKLYSALKETAEEINSRNKELGFYAIRKVSALSANSPLEKLIRCGNDLMVIAKKLESK